MVRNLCTGLIPAYHTFRALEGSDKNAEVFFLQFWILWALTNLGEGILAALGWWYVRVRVVEGGSARGGERTGRQEGEGGGAGGSIVMT